MPACGRTCIWPGPRAWVPLGEAELVCEPQTRDTGWGLVIRLTRISVKNFWLKIFVLACLLVTQQDSVLQFLSLSHFQAIKTIMFSCAQSQSCLTLCYPMGCSLPGSSVHGIFQTRILGWVAIPFSKVSSQPQDQTWVSCVSCIDKWILFTTEPAGKPWLRPQLLLLGNTTLWRPMEPSGKNHQHWWGSREMLAALTHRASRVCLCASNLIQ